jgi:hypothetical protein
MTKIKTIFFLLSILLLVNCSKEKSIPTEKDSNIDLVINEVMTYNSPNWIEIYNPGDSAINMEGFHIKKDNFIFTITGGIIDAKGFALFFCDAENFSNHTSFILSSSGGNIAITDKENNSIDRVYYPQMDQSVSFGRKPDGSANFQLLNTPTPSTTNLPFFLPNQAPKINEVVLFPEFPSAYQIVTINTNAEDDYGIDSLLLFYSFDGFDTVVQFYPFCCDPRKKSTEIKGLPAGSIVEYYIKAVDDSSLSTFYPLGAPGFKKSYTVGQ